jgi:hypothetical protein
MTLNRMQVAELSRLVDGVLSAGLAKACRRPLSRTAVGSAGQQTDPSTPWTSPSAASGEGIPRQGLQSGQQRPAGQPDVATDGSIVQEYGCRLVLAMTRLA